MYAYNVPAGEIEIRSLYMRLFNAHINGEPFYPAAFAGQHINMLMIRGHAERHEQGYRITESGCRAWADMNRFILTGTPNLSRNARHSTGLKQLIPFLKSGLNEEDDMSKLMDAVKAFLQQVDSKIPTLVNGIEKTVLMTAVRQGYVERHTKNTYTLTDGGSDFLNNGKTPEVVKIETNNGIDTAFNPAALLQRLLTTNSIERVKLTSKDEQEFMTELLREGHVTLEGSTYLTTPAGRRALDYRLSALSKPEGKVHHAPTAEAAANMRTAAENVTGLAQALMPAAEMPPTNSECGDCDDCLSRRVLDAVMEVNPDVRKLFEAMAMQDVILRNLSKR